MVDLAACLEVVIEGRHIGGDCAARTSSLVGGREIGLPIEIFRAVEAVQEPRQKKAFLDASILPDRATASSGDLPGRYP
jgi:hypothetical protein